MDIDPVILKDFVSGRSVKTTWHFAEGAEQLDPVYRFIARSNDMGHAWVQELLHSSSHWKPAERALKFLQAGKLEEGWSLLNEYASALQSVPNLHESLQAHLCRHYHAIAAYYFYYIGDFEQAHQRLRMAHEEVVKAISRCEFLIVLSVAGQEFCMHHARIARKARRWDEMHEYIERGRAMVTNRSPLCVLANGQSVYYSTLSGFFRALEPMTADEAEEASKITDDTIRECLFDRSVRLLLRLPGFATDWN